MKIYSREEALKQSIEYFGGDELAAEVFVTKYAMRDEKLELKESNPEQMHHRLAKEFARIENKYPNPMSEEEIFGLFDKFRYVVPQGSPMFGIGNPNQKISLSNCFVIDVADSYGGICRADERIAQISKRRGGVGLDISPIRPKGLPTKNSALTTDGIVVFMERFSNTSREVAQQGRRGALMLSISVHHPEVLNFIRAKRDLKKVTGANISVRITDEFMKAVNKKDTYEQRWPVDSDKPVIKNEVKAKEIWDELVKSNWLSGEPGILFWDTIIKNSPADSYVSDSMTTTCTNPCLAGDTKIYVADGRGDVSIRQLAEEGKDINVFCYDDYGKIVIRKMRHPRITGYNQLIYKVTMDDGHIVRCTGDHKFRLRSGEYKEAKDLVKGDSLKTIVKYEASIKDIFPKKSSNSQDYLWINNGFKQSQAEHRIIATHQYGNIEKGNIIHHIDYNTQNNAPSNLRIMTKEDHDLFHRKNMFGDKNPMRRAQTEWSEEKWQKYHDNMSGAVSKEKNGRYIGITNDELLNKAVDFTKEIGHRFSKKEWQKYARKNNLPIEFSGWRDNHFGGLIGLAKMAAMQCQIEYIDEDPRLVKTLKEMISQGYNSEIIDNKVYVNKNCEYCGAEFRVGYERRETGFCSIKCGFKGNSAKYKHSRDTVRDLFKASSEKNKNEQCRIYTQLKNKLNRLPMRKEWEKECKSNSVPFRLGCKYSFKNFAEVKERSEYYNHRVVSVEIDGCEDVYNGTVDGYHNFFIGGFEGSQKNNKKKWVYINNLQCGELPLGPGASCILLLQNLASYVLNPFTKEAKLNEELLRINTRKSQRLIDDMVDLEIEAIDKIIDKVKSDPESDEIKYNEINLWTYIKNTCTKSRRTGLGVTGLGDCIAMMNIKYGSKDSMSAVENIFSIIRDEAYRASIQMAKERGAFPIWDAKKEKDNAFLNRLPKDIQTEMAKNGRRNIACLTVPPAGSVSTLTQTTSGFEPVYMAEYIRKRKLTDNDKDKPDFIDKLGDKWKNYKIEHKGLKIFKQITGKEFKDSPYCGAQAEEIDYEARVKMQGIATSYMDHSISSTINLPNDIDIKVVEKLYRLAYEEGCKGLTIYRDGSRDGVLTKEASTNTRECDDCDEAGKKLKELIQAGQRPTKILLSPAPKRSEVMPCEIHRSKVGRGDWLFYIGMLNGQPYEVFGGNSNKFEIPHKYKDGWILKNGKNKAGITQYHLILGSLTDSNEKLEFKDINKHFNNKEYGAFTRMVSLSLRHGIPIRYICEQITKTGCAGDLFSFQRAMARILKKYIADGERSGTECSICHSDDVYYKNGCPTCKICGNSNCS